MNKELYKDGLKLVKKEKSIVKEREREIWAEGYAKGRIEGWASVVNDGNTAVHIGTMTMEESSNSVCTDIFDRGYAVGYDRGKGDAMGVLRVIMRD